MKYEVKDIKLAPKGHQKIEWVRNNMPILRGLEEEFNDYEIGRASCRERV